MPETAKKTAAPTGRAAAKATGDKLESQRQERIQERDRPRSVWDRLAEQFPADELEKLPRNLQSGDRNRGKCEDTPRGREFSADGYFCQGYHARSIHLDYVGHAGITMRLNSVLGPGGWEHRPLAMTPEGLPLVARSEFWATLTVTDPETGETFTKMDVAANFNGPQEMWGDSLRRVASRFGVGTYLWSKSDRALAMKRAEEGVEDAPEPPSSQRPAERQQAPQDDPRASGGQVQGITAHAQQVRDMVSSLNADGKDRLKAWWLQLSEAGNMPLLANMDAVTPEQAAWVEDAVVNIVEVQNANQAPPPEDEPPF